MEEATEQKKKNLENVRTRIRIERKHWRKMRELELRELEAAIEEKKQKSAAWVELQGFFAALKIKVVEIPLPPMFGGPQN